MVSPFIINHWLIGGGALALLLLLMLALLVFGAGREHS
jgi:Sec-independent protein translocase protein TatA